MLWPCITLVPLRMADVGPGPGQYMMHGVCLMHVEPCPQYMRRCLRMGVFFRHAHRVLSKMPARHPKGVPTKQAVFQHVSGVRAVKDSKPAHQALHCCSRQAKQVLACCSNAGAGCMGQPLSLQGHKTLAPLI